MNDETWPEDIVCIDVDSTAPDAPHAISVEFSSGERLDFTIKRSLLPKHRLEARKMIVSRARSLRADPMSILLAIEPLPRGERLARWLEDGFKTNGRGFLWFSLWFYARIPRRESGAAAIRAHARPLRMAREKARWYRTQAEISLITLGLSDEDIKRALEARAAAGVKKYGTPLRTHNGRDAREDAVQELLDALMYLAQAEMEEQG